MRTLAEVLYWAGRLEIVMLVVIAAHAIIAWHWRKSPLRCWLGVGWLLFFIVLLPTVFYEPIFRPLTNGVGYNYAHLYERIWTDEQALSNMLSGWKLTLIPVYARLLIAWLGGLIAIHFLSVLLQRAAARV